MNHGGSSYEALSLYMRIYEMDDKELRLAGGKFATYQRPSLMTETKFRLNITCSTANMMQAILDLLIARRLAA